jgi:hypothetical protein
LVVGNSRAVRLVLSGPNEPDTTFFNLAYRSTRRLDTIALVKDYFLLGNKAKIVLIEVSAMTRDAVNCELKTYWPWLSTLESTHRRECATDYWASVVFPVTRFNTQLFKRAAQLLVTGDANDQFRLAPFNNNISDSRCSRLPIRNLERARDAVRDADFVAIRKDIKDLEYWLDQNGVDTKLALVLAPYVQLESTRATVAEMQAASESEYSFLPYLDLSTSVGGNCINFEDATHLNMKGILYVRPRIKKFLAELMLSPDITPN